MKPRVRFLPRDGDAEKVVVALFTPDGQPAKEQLVQVSNCARTVGRGIGDNSELFYLVAKAIREFNREVAMGYW